MFMAADEFPLPYEYRFFDLDGLRQRAARGRRGAHDRVPGLRQHRPQPGRARSSATDAHILNIDHHHDNTRFGTVNHVVAGRVVHGGDRLGPRCAALGVELDRDDRRGALRRPGHRHRPLHVREHRPARARDGGRADRRRRRRARRSTGASTRACPYGKLELLARALVQRRALRRRRADDHAPQRARTSPRPAPRRATPRASSTTCAPSRARGRGAGRATCLDGQAGRRKVSLRATDDDVDVSRDRPRRGRRRPPPGGRASPPRCRGDELVAFLRDAGRRAALSPSWPTRSTASSSSTSPPGKTSHDVVAGRAPQRSACARSGTPARSTRSRPGCCSCSSGARRASSAS